MANPFWNAALAIISLFTPAEEVKNGEILREILQRMVKWGVLICKSFSDLDVTIVQSRDVDLRSRTTLIKSNYFAVCFARVKISPFNFFVF